MVDLQYLSAAELQRIRELDAEPTLRAAAFANACRINTLYMIMRAGSGHIGTSFSCLDIVSWLYLEELSLDPAPDGSRDMFFSSKGHDAPGLYSVLIGTERLDFDLIHALRRQGGLPGHPDVRTPGVETNTGPLGMGVSKAKGMIFANRLRKRSGNVVVLTGDGELQEGQLWESLASAVRSRMGELTVIVDHNKVQSDTWVRDVSDLGDLEAKFAAFGWEVARCDGHDIGAVAGVLERFRTITDRPKVLIADTLKGRGVSFMEPDAMDPDERLYKFHSGAPAPEVYARGAAELIAKVNAQLAELGAAPLSLDTYAHEPATPPPSPQRLIAAYSQALVEQGRKHPELVALDADLILDCGIIPFSKEFPERFVECGIAEQDMVSQAGAMAGEGLLPVVHSFSCFLSTRPNEQIYNNVTERTKVLYVAPLAGLVPAGPGHSHQSVRDISAVGGMPGLVMVEPSCDAEVGLALEYLVERTQESGYLRLVSIPVQTNFQIPAGYAMREGRGVEVRPGRDAVIVSYGPVMLTEACRAAEALAEGHHLDVAVVNLPWLNRVDAGWLRELATSYDSIFTLDNHYVAGGQGQMVAAAVAGLQLDAPPRVTCLGVTRIPVCGLNAEALKAHGLDGESLAGSIGSALGERVAPRR